MINLSLLLIGFSIFSSLLLLPIYFFSYSAIEKTWISPTFCCGLLLSLAGLQYLHFLYLMGDSQLLHSRLYGCLLLASAPNLYLFGREILQFNARYSPLLSLHFLPVLIYAVAPFPWLIPIAFSIGTAYSLCISFLLYRLKGQRSNFAMEFFGFASFALIALFILVLGLLSNIFGEAAYVMAYAILIGLAFFAMLYILLRFPDVMQKARDAVIASYAASTLKNVDRNQLAAKVAQLFEDQKIHRNENLSLADLAGELELTSHQTSELINTQFQVGFSRLVRQFRIADAQQQLISEPRASVLSIGLSVGFNSQSNFYAAFREITGQTPAQFRKVQGIAAETIA